MVVVPEETASDSDDVRRIVIEGLYEEYPEANVEVSVKPGEASVGIDSDPQNASRDTSFYVFLITSITLLCCILVLLFSWRIYKKER